VAHFKNPYRKNKSVVPNSEKKLCDLLNSERVPESWWFWHEPEMRFNKTPDFVLLVDDEYAPAVVIIELKDWTETISSFTDTEVFMKKGNRRTRGNPYGQAQSYLKKFDNDRGIFEDQVPNLQNFPVISLVAFWQYDRLPEGLQDGHPKIKTLLRDEVRNPEVFVGLIRSYIALDYSTRGVAPQPIAIDLRNILLKFIDPSLTVAPIQTQEVSTETQVSVQAPAPLPLALDPYQQDLITKEDFGLRLLGGLPGAGKTVILLGRARVHACTYPHKKRLFIVIQDVLISNLEHRYREHYAIDKETLDNVRFMRFEDWLKRTYQGVSKRLKGIDIHEKPKVIDSIIERGLSGRLEVKETAIAEYGHIFVDESHQLPTTWVRFLTRSAEGFKSGDPNVWIAHDNGQGIYRDRKLIREVLEKDFDLSGKEDNLYRIYRASFHPWFFAACCNPGALATYTAQQMGALGLQENSLIEFQNIGEDPHLIPGETYVDQAHQVADYIKERVKSGQLKWSDACIYYARRGELDRQEDNLNPTVLSLEKALNEAFASYGGIEWMYPGKDKDWSIDRVRACSFTSSQGLDTPLAIVFSIESFEIFDDGAFSELPLFYTVLTRCKEEVILTYNENADNKFTRALINGVTVYQEADEWLESLREEHLTNQGKIQLVWREIFERAGQK
jgi:hypothetical protein